MKKIITILVVIICLIALSRLSVESPKEEIDYNTVETVVEDEESSVEEETYTFEYTTIHFTHSPSDLIKISISYPQFKDEKLSTLNNKVEEFAKSNFMEIVNDENVDNLELTLEEEYVVKLANKDLISISSSGELTVKDAAYPTTIKSTLNINPIDYRKFKISDLININDEFVQLFIEQSMSNEQLDAYLTSFTNAEIKEKILASSLYFEEDSVVIVFNVPHAIGDYIEIKFENDLIKDFLI